MKTKIEKLQHVLCDFVHSLFFLEYEHLLTKEEKSKLSWKKQKQ
ncbi:hypothetical protein [Salipaludibacillus aurantiacus]|uniref:Uncharacterized protein n=1 Tax=Salipaludibacillus aurantiacus TaxID=1601833 RepID=A0A1H9NW65_9BACI|nr:hypothetical protein [Salipaludibacillus aurantiacus]SER40190.1 hypothetical protein SAMN05518684_10129 [Salipaludibacillus aurantiacus]